MALRRAATLLLTTTLLFIGLHILRHGSSGAAVGLRSRNFRTFREEKERERGRIKYFKEAGGTLELTHYDARFFRAEVPYSEHGIVLGCLVRSYLQTMAGLGVETWLAHGTLLGWWWNGQLLPWDVDVDVQVSYDTMVRMASPAQDASASASSPNGDSSTAGLGVNMTEHRFNYTDHDGRLAERVYLLDLNPHFAEIHDDPPAHEPTVHVNLIDARWIDTHTGLFVDITALRERHPERRPGELSCKDNHRYGTRDLWPLRKTEFEGVPASVPRAFEPILVKEYGAKSLVKQVYEGHRWDRDIKEWVKIFGKQAAMRKSQVAASKEAELRRDGRLGALGVPRR